MKLGEKLQQLRRQSGLSQEQLAAQLTVSRQAVSKWELDETMPDTENVVQLSRIFGVSCDYLLREEVDEQGVPVQPAAPGEPTAVQRYQAHIVTILSLSVCAVGLLMGIGWGLYSTSASLSAIAFLIQLGGILIFELAAPRMGDCKPTARLNFYSIACWLVLFVPLPLLIRSFLMLSGWSYRPSRLFLFCGLLYVLICASTTAALFVLRRHMAAKP